MNIKDIKLAVFALVVSAFGMWFFHSFWELVNVFPKIF